MSPVEALTQIRALCESAEADRYEWDGEKVVFASDLRAVLDAVSVDATPAQDDVLDALARVVNKAVPNGEDDDGFILGYAQGTGAIHNAIRVLQNHGITARPSGFEVQDRPTPAQGIDRDAVLRKALDDLVLAWYTDEFGDDQLVDRILALVRPVEGIVLSREEARRVVGWLDMSNLVPEGDDLALANRLEAL